MLHLILPNLTEPDTLESRPSLRALKARGHCAAGGTGLPAALCQAFGIRAPYPIAALSLLEDGGQAGTHYWLRADPMHLHINIDKLVLTDPATLSVTAEEAQALIASLNQHFGQEGLEFVAPQPDRWYCRPSSAPNLETTDPTHVINQAIDRHLPQGRDAQRWRSLINETQMLLHDHPVNQAREACGLAPINSIWPWGGGCIGMPESEGPVLAYGESPALSALAQATGAGLFPLPDGLSEIDRAEEIVLVLPNGTSSQHLESTWFSPLLSALKWGRLDKLSLYDTSESGLTCQIGRLDAWQIWKN